MTPTKKATTKRKTYTRTKTGILKLAETDNEIYLSEQARKTSTPVLQSPLNSPFV